MSEQVGEQEAMRSLAVQILAVLVTDQILRAS